MAWVAVDKNGDEYIFECNPHRDEDEWYETCDFLELPKGSIKKLIGRDLTWSDDTIELNDYYKASNKGKPSK